MCTGPARIFFSAGYSFLAGGVNGGGGGGGREESGVFVH